jgi:hypothetical protein
LRSRHGKGSQTRAPYRVYMIGPDGHFQNAIDLDCVNDTAAIESAQQLVDRYDFELWQQGRKIGRFDRKE